MTMIRPETEMKDSGVKWIGDIPESWTIRPLKSLYTLTTGFTPNSKDDSLYDENGETWVTIGDLKGDIIYNSKQKISKKVADMHRAEMTKQGSLMYSFKLSVGAVAVAGKDLFTNEAIASFLPKNRHGNLHYLKYASSLIIGNANTNIYGAFIMNQQLILNAPLPLPSPDEQQAIADYLDETCSKIDEIIAEAKASIDEYKELKQSVIFEAVTKGLDKNVEFIDSGDEWLGKYPKSYSIGQLSMLSNIVRGGSPRPAGDPRYYGGNIPFMRISDITKDDNIYVNSCENTITEEGLTRTRMIPSNTLLLTNSGATLGVPKINTFETTFNDGIAAFLDLDKRLNIIYVYFFLKARTSYFLEYASMGMGQPNLNTDIIGRTKIVFPTLAEQQKIVLYLKDRCRKLNSLIVEKESLINDLEAYKKSLIYEVVTGKRRVV